MCELFAISSKKPTAVSYSLPEFAAFGSGLRENRSGWGIAFAKDRDAFLVKEPITASDSPWVKFIADQALESKHVIAHVRRSTIGAHTMENTHPFRRALGNHVHFLAHNGTMRKITDTYPREDLHYQPVGETDSEHAFCILLTRLWPLYQKGTPSPEERIKVFTDFCTDMKKLGTCNFLYFDGEILFVHAHKRVWEEDGKLTDPKPPGLHIKECMKCAFQKEMHAPGLDVGGLEKETIVLASVPLDEFGWRPLDEGTVLALKDGKILDSRI